MSGWHSRFSPSSLSRLLACPASYRASEGLQLPSRVDTVTGTAAHEIHERALKTGKPASTWVLDTVEVEEHDRHWSILVDDVMCAYVQESVDIINAIPGDLYVEKRVAIDDIAPIPEQSGTCDVFKVDVAAKTLHPIDYKHGLGVRVDAYVNPQLTAYGLGGLRHIADVFDIEKVVIHIHQPRLDAFPTWETTPAELRAIGRFYKTQLARCLDPKAPYVPSASTCQFCGAKFTCKARAEQLARIGAGLFEGLDLIDQFNTDLPAHMPDIDLLTVDELLAIHKHSESVTSFLSNVKTHLLHLALNGETLPGKKLIAGRVNRSWRDEIAEREAANYLLSNGVAPSAVFKMDRPSVARAEALLPKARRADLQTWWIKPVGRPQIVDETDPRPAIEPVGLSMFEDLDDVQES